jgi:hypothetical protein
MVFFWKKKTLLVSNFFFKNGRETFFSFPIWRGFFKGGFLFFLFKKMFLFLVAGVSALFEPLDSYFPFEIQEVPISVAILQVMNATSVHDMTTLEQWALHELIESHITSDFIATHREFHVKWSIGGIYGAQNGSGVPLIGAHGAFKKSLTNRVSADFHLPLWDPQRALPETFALDRYASLGPENLDPQFMIPAFFTSQGETKVSFLNFTAPGDLGRYIGLSVHNGPHALMGSPMNRSAYSPVSAGFWFWHGHLQWLFRRWLHSGNGQAWKARHPNHPLLSSTSNARVFLDAFPQDEECFLRSLEPWCVLLAQKQALVDSMKN